MEEEEIRASAISTDKTPTKEEVMEDVCKKLNLDPSLVEIREIKQQYGLRVSDILLYSYASKEVMAQVCKEERREGKEASGKERSNGCPCSGGQEVILWLMKRKLNLRRRHLTLLTSQQQSSAQSAERGWGCTRIGLHAESADTPSSRARKVKEDAKKSQG